MNFADPPALWLLLTLPLFAVWLARSSAIKTSTLIPVQTAARRVETVWMLRALFFLFLCALSLLILAIARPQRSVTQTHKSKESIDIAIVLDVSESMDAIDFAPDRITVAKSVIRDFVERRDADRIALVTFGGESVTKVPLTYDHSFLLDQIDTVALRELKQGTAIGMGLSSGVARLRTSQSKSKVIVLLTDGDSNVGSINPITAAHLARQEGIKIYAVGIGREDRVVIPIYAYDSTGRKTQMIAQVPSYLNPELLRQIAHITGANAYMARDSGALEHVLREIDLLEKTKINERFSEEYEEISLPFILSALLLLFAAYWIQETRLRRVAPIASHFTAQLKPMETR